MKFTLQYVPNKLRSPFTFFMNTIKILIALKIRLSARSSINCSAVINNYSNFFNYLQKKNTLLNQMNNKQSL